MARLSTIACLGAMVLSALSSTADAEPRRLNSLVTEMARLEYPAGIPVQKVPGPVGRVTFDLPYECWLHVTWEGVGAQFPLDRAWVDIDHARGGVRINDWGERILFVPAGRVEARVWAVGAARARRLVIRRVPEIMVYMYEGENEPQPQRWITHSWEILNRSLLPSANLVVSPQRQPYERFARIWHDRGGRWIVNHGMSQLRDPETDPAEYWAEMLRETPYDGAIHDELLMQDAEHFGRYADGLMRFAQMPESRGRRIYLFSPSSVMPAADLLDHFVPDDAAHSGDRSIRALAQGEGNITARQIGVPMEPGRQYTLSAWMRSEDVRRAPYTGVFIIDEGWFRHYAHLRPEEGTTDWTHYRATFTPGESRNGLYQVVMVGPGSGTLWIDAVQLQAGPDATAFTTDEPNLLRNASFEDGLTDWMRGMARIQPLVDAAMQTGAIFAPEMYMHEQENARAARELIDGYLVGKMRAWRDHFEGIERHILVTLSAGNVALRYSNDRRPDVNYKVHLDMQFHAMATDPAFRDVWGVGFWSGHYLDEELMRWYGALFRHYCIEGNRSRLTDDPYVLDHLTNPGFEAGLEGWETSGEIEAVPVAEMPEGARGGTHAPVPEGEWVVRTTGEGASVQQQIRNLEPGRLYSARVYCANPRYSEALIPAEMAVDGGQVLAQYTRDQIWQSGETHWTMHYRVFRALGTEARLTITDAGPGEVYWDFVQVEPFFEG